jgi:hypothetical protein
MRIMSSKASWPIKVRPCFKEEKTDWLIKLKNSIPLEANCKEHTLLAKAYTD